MTGGVDSEVPGSSEETSEEPLETADVWSGPSVNGGSVPMVPGGVDRAGSLISVGAAGVPGSPREMMITAINAARRIGAPIAMQSFHGIGRFRNFRLDLK